MATTAAGATATNTGAVATTDWNPLLRDEFAKPYWNTLQHFVAGERARHVVFPAPDDVFAALHLTPYAATRVVILGQDPYHGPGQAHGFVQHARAQRGIGLRQLRQAVEQRLEVQHRPAHEQRARAAGLDPVPRVWLVGDNIINAFATYGDNGENIFVFSGILLWLRTPNELIGVMAHEIGHMAGGHVARSREGMENAAMIATLATLLGMAAAIGSGHVLGWAPAHTYVFCIYV